MASDPENLKVDMPNASQNGLITVVAASSVLTLILSISTLAFVAVHDSSEHTHTHTPPSPIIHSPTPPIVNSATPTTTTPTPVQEFFFAMHKTYTPRQGGRIADLLVRYRYSTWGFDYRPHYRMAEETLASAVMDELTVNSFWEDVAIHICQQVWQDADPPLLGVTCALQVGSMQHSASQTASIDKPGDLNCTAPIAPENAGYCSDQPGHSHGTVISLGDAPYVAMPLNLLYHTEAQA